MLRRPCRVLQHIWISPFSEQKVTTTSGIRSVGQRGRAGGTGRAAGSLQSNAGKQVWNEVGPWRKIPAGRSGAPAQLLCQAHSPLPCSAREDSAQIAWVVLIIDLVFLSFFFLRLSADCSYFNPNLSPPGPTFPITGLVPFLQVKGQLGDLQLCWTTQTFSLLCMCHSSFSFCLLRFFCTEAALGYPHYPWHPGCAAVSHISHPWVCIPPPAAISLQPVFPCFPPQRNQYKLMAFGSYSLFSNRDIPNSFLARIMSFSKKWSSITQKSGGTSHSLSPLSCAEMLLPSSPAHPSTSCTLL